jgi:hypothetical protein
VSFFLSGLRSFYPLVFKMCMNCEKEKNMDWGSCSLLECHEKNLAKLATDFSNGTLLSDSDSNPVPSETTHALSLYFPARFK